MSFCGSRASEGPNWEVGMEKPEVTREHKQKAWRQPELRKLTIAATASSTKGQTTADDGGAGGKGDLLFQS
jgi:hypothetical protein